MGPFLKFEQFKSLHSLENMKNMHRVKNSKAKIPQIARPPLWPQYETSKLDATQNFTPKCAAIAVSQISHDVARRGILCDQKVANMKCFDRSSQRVAAAFCHRKCHVSNCSYFFPKVFVLFAPLI